jgi:predicted acyltransferase
MKKTEESAYSAPGSRLYSLDALRGFDMFWIIGAEEIFHSLAILTGYPLWVGMAEQLTHPAWNGFHFYDLIFPLFLFLAGVATPYSVGRDLENGKTRKELLFRVIRRGLLLVLLGIVYNNGLKFRASIDDYRLCSVLARIGLAYMFANIIYLYSKQTVQAIWFVVLLVAYWLVLKFNSAPGFAPGDLSMEGNFASYIDRSILPGRLYLKIHDPEGLMSLIPSISTALLGIMTGSLLKNSPKTKKEKVVYMALAGIISISIALIWNLDFPINKNLWTSSFVMLVGGLSLILLSLFYYIIDVLGYKKWAFFFKVIGMNSILIYVSGRVIDWEYANNGLFTWLFQLSGEPYDAVVKAIFYVLVQWGFLYFLYKKNVFLRV